MYEWVRFESAEPDLGEAMVFRAEPNRRALPDTVQTIHELHDKRYCGRIGCFVTGGHLGDNVFLHDGVQKCRPDL